MEVKGKYKRQICWSNSALYRATLLQPLRVIATMSNITFFFVFTVISLGLAKRSKPAPPAHILATSLNTSDIACPSDSVIDMEAGKMKTMLDADTWFPCDCGGLGWEKIAFYDFSQQECPPNFTRLYGEFNNVSCRANNTMYNTCDGYHYYYSSLPLHTEGRSYSSVCGRVRGHGHGDAFFPAIACNYSLEQTYADGVSLTHGPAGRRRHIWTFAAADADGDPRTGYTRYNCVCSNTNIHRLHVSPDYVGYDYFCDSFKQHAEGIDNDDDLWDGEGCGSSSSCCKWKDPPYFCKHLHNITHDDIEIRLFSVYSKSMHYYTPTLSFIEIFVR